MLRKLLLTLLCTCIWASFGATNAADLSLTLDIPACKNSPGKPLPSKYYVLAKKYKEYRWVNRVKPTDLSVSGSGLERTDGSALFGWLTLTKLDLDGDGWCDWAVENAVPMSSGGDSDVLNTFYLGSPKGWKRIGATISDNKPDEMGFGNSDNVQADFTFYTDTPYVIRDIKSGKNYLIGIINQLTASQSVARYGINIFTVNPIANSVAELDKWKSGGEGAQVYQFLKQHGAADLTTTGYKNKIWHVDAVDAEFDQGCIDDRVLARSAEFARLCKSRNENK